MSIPIEMGMKMDGMGAKQHLTLLISFESNLVEYISFFQVLGEKMSRVQFPFYGFVFQ